MALAAVTHREEVDSEKNIYNRCFWAIAKF